MLLKKAEELDGIKIIRYERSVYFANVDNFKYKIMKLSSCHTKDYLDKINAQIKKIKKKELKNKSLWERLKTKPDPVWYTLIFLICLTLNPHFF